MKAGLISFLSGIHFAIGLSISGMVNPDKVRGFLDITGQWDLSLAFVMIGAIGLNLFTFKWIIKRKPWCSDGHQLSDRKDIDARLIIGAILFGAGWGLLGVCPGPAIVNIATFDTQIFVFLISMFAGMGLFGLVGRNR
jgi:uncharacterized membrane protein YedE/YeeE